MISSQQFSYLKGRLLKHSRAIRENEEFKKSVMKILEKQDAEIKALKNKIYIITTADER